MFYINGYRERVKKDYDTVAHNARFPWHTEDGWLSFTGRARVTCGAATRHRFLLPRSALQLLQSLPIFICASKIYTGFILTTSVALVWLTCVLWM
jgi:hypothetical protein